MKSKKSLTKTISFCLFLVLFSISGLISNAQSTYTPAKYYTFNNSNITLDSMGGPNMNLTSYGSVYSQINGNSGKAILFHPSSYCLIGNVTVNDGIAIELMMKPSRDFNTVTTTFMGANAGSASFSIAFGYDKIYFRTNHKSSSGADIYDNWVINLTGIGRGSYNYLIDGNWHHLVFNFNATTGKKEIWIDGQLPQGFSKTLTAGSFNNSTFDIKFGSTVDYVMYKGALDELAYYDEAIPASLIYKHYLQFLNGESYSFVDDYTGSIPTADPVSAGIDPLDYPPNHPNVTIQPDQQLSLFPSPRYKSNHTMLRNFNWCNPLYIGGQNQGWNNTSQGIADVAVGAQEQLTTRFNYYFEVPTGYYNTPKGDDQRAWINAHPNIPASVTLLRGKAGLYDQNRPADHYFQNSSGQFLDANGNVTSNKIWRPTAPISSYANEGQAKYNLINQMGLTRPISIINENGENFAWYTDAAMQLDPALVADKPNYPSLTWGEYMGQKIYENETGAYRDIFMAHPDVANDAIFSEYWISGHPNYGRDYKTRRQIGTQINGQYYSTSDFYVRWPSNWRYWVSSWHGWQWFVESRHVEIGLGDKYFSPFVAAGWAIDPETNVRPGQWLGLLKSMSNFGAEFMYTGHFSGEGGQFPDSRNWIWQTSTPSYSQAVFSKVEDLYKNSNIMEGDVPSVWIPSQNPHAGYSFLAGGNDMLVTVRKHNSQDKYLIVGTVQPMNNMIGNVIEKDASITLDGNELQFKVRKQGSVYAYDKTTTPHTFYQLDGWHESTHPYYWSKDFEIESELFDNPNGGEIIKTEKSQNLASNDYTEFTSYITWNSTLSTVEYEFQNVSSGNYYLWVRAKSKDGTPTGMSIVVDGNPVQTIGCITDTNWVWYRYDVQSNSVISYNLINDNHRLAIAPDNSSLCLDKTILTMDSNLGLNNNGPNCTTIAIITANGQTTFCEGENVTLTASPGTSYLWSTGAITQSITVNSSGNYSATITTQNGTATSNVIEVIVNPNPTATVTPNGSTTICDGQTITLFSSVGTGYNYLWSNGSITQDITVGVAGNYFVTVTDNNGCSSISNQTTVIVNICITCDKPNGLTTSNVLQTSADIAWNPVTSASNGYTIRLRNVNTAAVEYINTLDTNLSLINLTPSTKYRWSVRSKCANGEKSNWNGNKRFRTKKANTRVESPDSLLNITSELPKTPNCKIDDFDMYPNPANNSVNMCFKSPVKSKVKIIFYSNSGQAVKIHEMNGELDVNTVTLSIDNLLPGIYNVKVISDSFIYSKQLTVIKL